MARQLRMSRNEGNRKKALATNTLPWLDSTRFHPTTVFFFKHCWLSLLTFSCLLFLIHLTLRVGWTSAHSSTLYSTHCCTHRFSSTHVIWLHIPVLIFTQPSAVSCWRLIGGSDWCSPPAAHEEFSHGSGFLNTAALKIHLSHTSHCPSNHDDNAFQHITI